MQNYEFVIMKHGTNTYNSVLYNYNTQYYTIKKDEDIKH